METKKNGKNSGANQEYKRTEFKTFKYELKNVQDDDGLISGYASTFGNVDLGDDVVVRGAFKKTIQSGGAKVPILDQHNWNAQLGWNLEAKEDERGLFVVGEMNMADPVAIAKLNLAKQAIKIGAKMGLSIGYRTILWEADRDDPNVRRLTELKLMEYSFATFPMNPEANITDAKNNQERAEYMVREMLKDGIEPEQIIKAVQPDQPQGHDLVEPHWMHSLDSLIEKMKG